MRPEPTSVVVSASRAQRLSLPRFCACCGAAPGAQFEVVATHVSGADLGIAAAVALVSAAAGAPLVYGRSTVSTWQFPACAPCARHLTHAKLRSSVGVVVGVVSYVPLILTTMKFLQQHTSPGKAPPVPFVAAFAGAVAAAVGVGVLASALLGLVLGARQGRACTTHKTWGKGMERQVLPRTVRPVECKTDGHRFVFACLHPRFANAFAQANAEG